MQTNLASSFFHQLQSKISLQLGDAFESVYLPSDKRKGAVAP